MPERAKYKTKQRDLVLGYLETVPNVHVTANEICAHFKEQGAPIGQSTIYRQLERLVDEGIIKKYIIDANSPACFEYVCTADHHQGPEICYHCKCEKCGTLIHLHCEELEEFQKHLYAEHHFKMDPVRTVFYGLCEQCL